MLLDFSLLFCKYFGGHEGYVFSLESGFAGAESRRVLQP
jgi:hypothetical protein